MSELYASVASCKLPINDSFLSISLRNKTFNGVPEHVYIGDSERNALSLQYAKAYLRYIKPGTVWIFLIISAGFSQISVSVL